MSYIAPAGTRIAGHELLAGLLRGLARGSAERQLAEWARGHSGTQHCWPMVSARAAMTVVFRAMRTLRPDRDTVIVPGYTCYSVPAAAQRAGLKVQLCDVSPDSLGLDIDKLRQMDFSRVLAVVTANLYGVPNDLAAIEAIAQERGVLMLDDAAQALGARLGGRPAGGFGDAGLYSFDKGKNVTTIQGGLIVARSGPLADALRAEYERLPPSPGIDTAKLAAKLAAYVLLLRPWLFGQVRRLPGLGLGLTRWEVDSPINRYSRLLAGVVLQQLARLPEITAGRVANALALEAALRDVALLRPVSRPPSAEPAFARLPLLARDAATRDALVSRLDAAGIGATASYPRALVDVPEVAPLLATSPGAQTGARLVASTVLTLPTHAWCPPDLPVRVRALVGGA